MAALPEPFHRKELPGDGSDQKQSPRESGIQKQECLGPGWSLRAKHGYILEAVTDSPFSHWQQSSGGAIAA